MAEPNKYRIAFLDVENSPNVAYAWAPGKYDKNLIAFQKPWYLLAFSVLWADEEKPKGYVLPDYPLYKKDPTNDFELVKDLWRVINEADLIVTHNGIQTDLPKARSRFLIHGLTPPSPAKLVDTLLVARKQFYLNGNSLKDLANTLDVPHKKVENEGFDLWLRCMNEYFYDKEAWETMRKYNIGDSLTLREVYDRLKTWHPNHPNITIASGESFLCPTCGSNEVEKRGLLYLQSFAAQRYRCRNCGHWSSGKRHKLQNQLLKSA